jgi:hypothetical protein
MPILAGPRHCQDVIIRVRSKAAERHIARERIVQPDEPFYVTGIIEEDGQIRLSPESLDGLSSHGVDDDAGMAIGLLVEVARVLGILGYAPNPELPGPIPIADPRAVLTGEQPLPWRKEQAGIGGLVEPRMYCFEGHGRPWLCTAP